MGDMQKLVFVFALALPAVALAGGRSYNDVQTINHDCSKEPDVSVNTSSVKATFTGTCDRVSLNGSSLTVKFENIKKLSVNGSSNTVDGDGADRISVNGADNKVSYKKSVDEKKTKISNLGAGNKVTQTK
jgi:hypothetical protein